MDHDYPITDLTSMKEILEIAIRRAEDSYAFDQTAAERAQIKTTKGMFLQMAEEEIEHKAKLQKELEELITQIQIDEAIAGESY
jgi:rubrerythrin